VAVEMERSFSPLGNTGSHSPSLRQFSGHVSGDRRVGALLRQELAGSNPVGGSSIENIPDKGSTRVLPTPDPAPTVFRSPALITWATSWSHTSPQEPEIRVQIPASCRANARQGSEDSVFRRWNSVIHRGVIW